MASGVATISVAVLLRNLGSVNHWRAKANITSLRVLDPRQGYISATSTIFALPLSGAKGIYLRNVSAVTSGFFSSVLFMGLSTELQGGSAYTDIASGAIMELAKGEGAYLPLPVRRSGDGSRLSGKFSGFTLASRHGVSYEFVVLGY